MRRQNVSPQRWLAETHSTRFELCRHFFERFFDSELISVPGQGRVVAGGVLAIVVSIAFTFTQAYYHKYLVLNALDDFRPQQLAEMADVLFLNALAMIAATLFTTLAWPSLFPALQDYLALASLPVRPRDLFVAKF